MNYDIKGCGKRIRQLRMESGLTQENAALALGINRNFYNRIEMGKKGCSIDLFIQLSDLFHTSLDYLILGRHSDALLDAADKARMKKDLAEVMAHLEVFSNSF